MAIARDIKDETVKLKTGKYSSEWYEIIDTFGNTNHTQIAKYLRKEYKLNPWWAQIITNRYEWRKGLRNQ